MTGRRTEILDTAERHFLASGYLGCSVADIIDELGIAKGTFYHHFSSKEAVMLAVIDRHIVHITDSLMPIATDTSRPALERLGIMLSGKIASQELATELETPGNEQFHATALAATVRELTPVIARVFADGTDEGTFHIADPTATAAVFLAVTTQLIDADIMGWRKNNDLTRLAGLFAAAEQLLGVTPGTLADLLTTLKQGSRDAHP